MNTHSIEPAKEPSPAASSLPTSLSDLVTEHPDWESAPEVQTTCPHCQTKYWHNQLLASVFHNAPCDACADTYNGLRDSKQSHHTISTSKDFLDTFLPPALQDTDPDLIPKRLLPVTQWMPKDNGIGLWITGDTRTFKTRSLSLLVKNLLIHKCGIITFFHGQFHDQLLDTVKSDRSLSLWKKKLSSIPILVIDDLFASKLTEHSESTIFEIIDSRTLHYLPTIVTTQFTKQDAKHVFAQRKRHEAFFARIKEFFSLVTSNPPKQYNLHND